MKIHNVLEEVVLSLVNEVFEEEDKKPAQTFCTCYQCRLDVACYVLNRVSPEYVLSGRGLAHFDNIYTEKLQRTADIVSLIKNGIDRISHTKRPHFEHINASLNTKPEGFFMNFPTIMGRLFHGLTFEPVADETITLLRDGKPVDMIDPNWQNPYRMVKNTAGTFLFWPSPEEAAEDGLKQTIEFELSVDSAEFEPLHHYFKITVESEGFFEEHFSLSKTHNVKDLYLIPK